jgi:hypothetical protein
MMSTIRVGQNQYAFKNIFTFHILSLFWNCILNFVHKKICTNNLAISVKNQLYFFLTANCKYTLSFLVEIVEY